MSKDKWRQNSSVSPRCPNCSAILTTLICVIETVYSGWEEAEKTYLWSEEEECYIEQDDYEVINSENNDYEENNRFYKCPECGEEITEDETLSKINNY